MKDAERQRAEEKAKSDKTTPPELIGKLEINDGVFWITLLITNDIPVRFTVDVLGLQPNGKWIPAQRYPVELYPLGRPIVYRWMSINLFTAPESKFSALKLKVEYESIYFLQSRLPTLQKVFERNYKLAWVGQTLKEDQ